MSSRMDGRDVPKGSAMAGRSLEGRPYLAAIDGLRAVAVVAVMLFHLNNAALPGGFVGVDVFFVISGYVVTGSMLSGSQLSYGRFIAAFYARRFRRIVPALVVCLGITFLASEAVIPDGWLSRAIPDTGKSAFFGFSNYTLIRSNDGYFATGTAFNPFTHTWSLAVEEQFYLFFPLILFFSLQTDRPRIATATRLILYALGLSSLAYCAWASSQVPSEAYYLLPSRFWELGAGAAACLIGQKRREAIIGAIGMRFVLITGAAFITLAAILADKNAFPFPWAIPAVVGSTLLILAASVGGRFTILTLLSARPMIAIGLRSYSLYLWHWPVYTLLRWTTGLETPAEYAFSVAATAMLAELSYQFIERPTQQIALIRAWPNVVTVAAGLILMLGGRTAASVVTANPHWFSYTTVEANRNDWYPAPLSTERSVYGVCDSLRADSGLNTGYFRPINCTGRPALHGRTLFVVGDSHAGAYDRMFDTTVRQTGITVVRVVKAGCPWFDFRRINPTFDADCPAFKAKTLDAVIAESKPGDIVFVTSLRIPRLTGQTGFGSQEDENIRAFATAAAMANLPGEREARTVAEKLKAKGLKLLIDLPKPVFAAPPFRCSDVFNRMNPVCAPGLSVSRSVLERLRQPVVSRLEILAKEEPDIVLWDPFPLLCSLGPKCNAMRNGRPLFFDGDHLSGYGNEVLVASFVDRLTTMIASEGHVRVRALSDQSGLP